MIWNVGILLVLVALVSWAIHAKVKLKRHRSLREIEGAIASPASLAIGELIAVAGGIYLSLVLMVSFLKLKFQTQITLYHFKLDPLALVALTIALLQPILGTLIYRLFKR